jgi:carboxyl-terminal processing protease
MGRTDNKTWFQLILLLLVVSMVLFFNGNSRPVTAGTGEIYKNIELLTEVIRKIEKSYVEPQDGQKLIEGAIKGMVQSLDPHSSFLTKEEHQDLLIETKGSFSGVGIEITVRDNLLTVVSPIEGTPAYKAGIQAGDKIIKIDGKPTADMTLPEAVKSIRGERGTKVDLTIMREGAEKPLEFTLTRDLIPIKSVRTYLLTPEIAYVRITNFQSKTATDLAASLQEMEMKIPLRGLILDLRNNPGGLLSQAIEVSDLFLNAGVIVSTKGRDSSQDLHATAHKEKVERTYPIIALVNGGSASAAEIVAGALQDNKRAIILGTKTFGKGSVQTIIPLSDGSGLRLTTAIYYTPNGRSIQASGISPDIELKFIPPPEEEKDDAAILREKDLKGHMQNQQDGPKEPEKTDEEKETEKRVKTLIERDNQVRSALQLLQTWNIFSQMKTGS